MTDVQPSRGAAFSPGHITGFFEIHDEHADPLRRGSRGAGFSLAHGATTYVEIEPADSMEIEVVLDKELQGDQDAPVTRAALVEILKQAVRDLRVPLNRDAPQGRRAKIRVRAVTDLQLPVSQGFGMSAAGGLSAAIALTRALRMGRSEALRAAHLADVANQSGLGDVIGASVGGFEIRTAPGMPPYGETRSFVGYGDAVLCVMGGRLPTRDVLRDPDRRARVNESGGKAVDALLQTPTLDAFLHLSQRFARDSGFMTPQMERAIEAARPHGVASVSMLGNSLFAFGNVPRLADALSSFGEVHVVPVSMDGARPLEFG